jgi:hypothetical protein
MTTTPISATRQEKAMAEKKLDGPQIPRPLVN